MKMSGRRRLLAAAPLLPLVAIGRAKSETTDLAVMCDLTLGPASVLLGSAFRAETGVHINVFPTAPGLILPQLARDVQNDIILTQVAQLDLGDRQGLLATDVRSPAWRDPLVIAEMTGAAGTTENGSVAISELPSASGIDGDTIAEHLNLDPARIQSAIDTEEVAFLLTSGRARSGLLYLTDVRADPRLRVIRAIEESRPMWFAAAVTKLARRPDPTAFIRFLGTPPAAAVLSSAGLDARS